MPDVTKMEYAGETKKTPVTGPKPVSGGKNDKWANESRTRGNKATGRSLGGKAESTSKGYTKLSSLKRG